MVDFLHFTVFFSTITLHPFTPHKWILKKVASFYQEIQTYSLSTRCNEVPS